MECRRRKGVLFQPRPRIVSDLLSGGAVAHHWQCRRVAWNTNALNWSDKISQYWPHLAAAFDFLAALLASVHALLHKRDSRAATLWLGIIWFLPLFGPILYLSLGVN